MAKSAKKQVTYREAWYVVASARIVLGVVFLWAFFDKLFGFGMATKPGSAWIDGASPTSGYLLHGVNVGSPLADWFQSLAGSPFVDWLFMLGLLGIGVALFLGVGLRIAAVTGSVLMLLMWASGLPLSNNPIFDEHIVYALVIWVAALSPRKWSLVDAWLAIPFVKKHSWLW